MLDVANSWWMYLLGAIVVVFVLAGSFFFIFSSLKEAKRINMDKDKIKKVILSSAIFTLLPSVSILIGVVALSGTIGVPLPWIRLTVIGALHYESSAVSTVQTEYLKYAVYVMNNEMFVTIAFVMTIGILVGPLFCLFGFKFIDKKILSKTKIEETAEEVQEEVTENQEAVNENLPEVKEEPKKKRSLGDLIFSAAFIAMVCSFTAVEFSKLARGTKDETGAYTKEPTNVIILFAVVIVTFGFMALCDLIEKKLNQKWLSNFSLGFSMIVGMAVAVLLGMVI